MMADPKKFLAVETRAPDLRLAAPFSPNYGDPAKYEPAAGLREAIDAAMLLGIPLLITGEPGTGKSSAAAWLARELGGARLLRFNVKSTTMGRELLYTFDEVARFRDANANALKPLIDYVRLSELGEAIVRASGGSGSLKLAKDDDAMTTAAFGPLKRAPVVADLLPRDENFATAPAEHCVVLIDELDKAPRDTPNDLLYEIEQMAFAITELGVELAPDATRLRPIVLITSNSERALPEPFLRRCAYFDIPPPGEAMVATIAARSVKGLDQTSPLFKSIWAFYEKLRSENAIRKKPGIAELLSWSDCLIAQAKLTPTMTLEAGDTEAIGRTLGCLVKTRDDLATIRALLKTHTALIG
jgi:MoxR-like ATPase